MEHIYNVNALIILIIFFIPGYLISATREQFIIERSHLNSHEFIFKIIQYSLLNYAILSGAIYYFINTPSTDLIITILQIMTTLFITPLILGILLGIATQKEWCYKLFRKFNLKPTHITPSAWDWKFKHLSPTHMLVTLKDDTRYAGWFSVNSFASSDPNQRDLYIEKVYDITANNSWLDRGDDSVLICANEIKTIEFISEQERGKHD